MDSMDPADRFEHWALLLTLRDKTLDRFVLEHPAVVPHEKRTVTERHHAACMPCALA